MLSERAALHPNHRSLTLAARKERVAWACGPPKVMKTMRENRLAGGSGSACPTLAPVGQALPPANRRLQTEPVLLGSGHYE